VIVRSDWRGDASLAALGGHRVAVTQGYALEEYVRGRFPGVRLVPLADDTTCLTALSFGRVDAAVVNLAIASYLIERQGITNLRVAEDSGRSNPLAIATRNDQPILRAIMAKGLASVTPAERDAIRARWIRMDVGGVVVSQRRALRWVAGGLGVPLCWASSSSAGRAR